MGVECWHKKWVSENIEKYYSGKSIPVNFWWLLNYGFCPKCGEKFNNE